MRATYGTILAVLLGVALALPPASAQPTPKDGKTDSKTVKGVKFPDAPKPLPPKIDPKPKPQTDPSLPTEIGPGELYVVEGEAFEIRAYPAGVVSVSKTTTGPRTITAKFVGGTGDYEDRTFAGPTVAVVKGVTQGDATIVVRLATAKSEADWIDRAIRSNVGPRPPPAPTPVPVPPTPVPPTPVPVPAPDEPPPINQPGLRVLYIIESGDAIPAPQHSAIWGKTVSDYLMAKTPKGKDGTTPEYRVWDKDTPIVGHDPHWSAAMTRAKGTAGFKTPWVIVSDGKSKAGSYEGPVLTVDEMMVHLRRAAGEVK